MSDNCWEETVRKVAGMWTGKDCMDDGPIGVMVANAVTNYMAAVLMLGHDALDQKFECFVVHAYNNEQCARVGHAQPHMNAIACTVVAMMSEPTTIEKADEEWEESVKTRFAQAKNAAWSLLAADTSRNIMMLMVPKEVIDCWMEGATGRTPDGCPAGIVRALEDKGWDNNGIANRYQVIVPTELAKVLLGM